MTSSERIGHALNSGNLRQDEWHTDIDVVAALAFASRLGASLQALKSAGQFNEIGNSVYLLSLALSRASRKRKIGVGKDKAEPLARQALIEWLIGACRACNGTGHRLASYSPVAPDKPKKNSDDSCPHCSGTGVFSPTWAWRRQMLNLPPGESKDWWEKRLEFAKEIAQDAFASAQRKVTVQLLDLLEP